MTLVDKQMQLKHSLYAEHRVEFLLSSTPTSLRLGAFLGPLG